MHAAVEGASHLDRACDHSPSKGGQSSFIPNRKHHHLLICIEPNRSSARFRCNATPAASNEKCREDSDDQGGQSLDLTLPKIETELRTDTNALHVLSIIQYAQNRTDRLRTTGIDRHRHRALLLRANFCKQCGLCNRQSIQAIWHGIAPTCAHSRAGDARCTHA